MAGSEARLIAGEKTETWRHWRKTNRVPAHRVVELALRAMRPVADDRVLTDVLDAVRTLYAQARTDGGEEAYRWRVICELLNLPDRARLAR